MCITPLPLCYGAGPIDRLSSPAARTPRLPSHRLTVAAVVTCLAALVSVAPVGAQSEDDLEDVQAQQDQVGERLDVLRADHDELEAAVADAADRVRQQEAAKREAEQQLEMAQAEVRAAQTAVTDTRAQIADLRVQAEREIAEAYMNPDPSLAVIESGNLTDATRREALLTSLTDRHVDVLDDLSGLETDLVSAEEQAREAREAVEVHRVEVEARLADYRAELAEQQRLRGALEERIAAVQAEAADLAEQEDEIRAIIAARASTAPESASPTGRSDGATSAAGLSWPAQGTITGVFGENRGDHIHAGIDIAASTGTPIYAADSGTVIGGCGSGYGNCILIDHGNGLVTLYAHMTSVFVSSGSVSRGQNIGTMGCTGSCTGPHLHFETRVNGVAQDPMNYLP